MVSGKEEFYLHYCLKDELMKSLEMSGLGCYIEHIFAGALCCSDDMKLLSLTRRELQK